MEKLVLIDGNSLINRAFYAMPLLTTKDGVPTNAVYGFMNMFFKMLSEVKPTFVAVAFDLKAPTFRHKMYAEYKGTRKPMPEELRPQIPLLKDILRSMNVCVMEKEGSEADDIIGTIAKHTSVQTYIYTGDKDSFQLVDNETTVYFTRRGITEIDVYDKDNFKEKTGINPIQIIDLKALMGDSSDNIPGIPGVGEKTALSLVQEYGDIDNLYAHTSELKGKLKEKVESGKELCYLSKTLATIDTDCGVDTDVEKMRVVMPFPADVRKRFTELEFKSLVNKENIFSDGETEKSEEKTESKAIIENAESVDDIKPFIGKKHLSFSKDDNYINLSDGEKELKIKIRNNLLDDGFTESDVINALKPVFGGESILIVYDKKALKKYLSDNFGLILTAACEDLSLVVYLADFNGAEDEKTFIARIGEIKDAPATSLFKAYFKVYEKLKETETENLYREIELPLSDVLFDMECSGFKVDEKSLSETGKRFGEFLASAETEIRNLCDEPTLNVNSPKQLGEVLFDKLKLGKAKKTKTGYSTSADVLEKLEGTHPIVKQILNYRRIQKLQSTYVEGFKPLIDKKTGLIHTVFNQTVTATGRLSSKEPNLQNIPVREDEGRELRRFFVPRTEDGYIISADYSQIELRLLAAFSGCKPLIDAFNHGKDIHSDTASKVFGVRPEEVTPAMRRSAKAVNFGIIYGISEYGLAKNINVTAAEAREYIKNYFKQYPEVDEYMKNCVKSAKEKGYAVTMLGRRRYIKELSAESFPIRQFGERIAMNMPLQGSAADIIKIAMIKVAKRLKEERLKSLLILQVHDELIIDAVKEEKATVEKILKEEMENAVHLSVPLTVEIGSGKTWYEAK